MSLRRILSFGVSGLLAAGVAAAPLATAAPRPAAHPAAHPAAGHAITPGIHPTDYCGIGGCYITCYYFGGANVPPVGNIPPVGPLPCPSPDEYPPAPVGVYEDSGYSTMPPTGCCSWYLQQDAILEFVNGDTGVRQFDSCYGPPYLFDSGPTGLGVREVGPLPPIGTYQVCDSLNHFILGTLHVVSDRSCGDGFGVFGPGGCSLPCGTDLTCFTTRNGAIGYTTKPHTFTARQR